MAKSTISSRSGSRKLVNPSHHRPKPASSGVSMHWLFRSNIPRRRGQPLPNDVRKRNFFGLGEIISVITNPAETVRSLTESKRLLEEARREVSENRERAQLRPAHTFSRLPGFFPRPTEVKAIERALEGEPAFTILFGASSVGKTALLREVLSHSKYHVLHFDLRIAGFADLSSLYMSLSQQMEMYFEAISKSMKGYEEFKKEAWGFKHDRLNVERRVTEGNSHVKVSDIARLMELFQSALLKYWEFQPEGYDHLVSGQGHKRDVDSSSDATHVENGVSHQAIGNGQVPVRRTWASRIFRRSKKMDVDNENGKNKECVAEKPKETPKRQSDPQPPPKRIPIIFFDEAHTLPALIHSTEAMKCLLDSMLVLTKQDRLCHVIHSTSDPFYQTWLRQLNIMQHCKIITIGDCSKAETRAFFQDRLLSKVPEPLLPGLDFDELYDAFGGKLVHWQDYITDYVNANGNVEVKRSSHFSQAHALLNLHIVHASQSPSVATDSDRTANGNAPGSSQTTPTGSGFKIYSPVTHPHLPQVAQDSMNAPGYTSDFSAMELLRVMSRLTQDNVLSLPYFVLCREMGVQAIDGMVKGRILDLRWTDPPTQEGTQREATSGDLRRVSRHSPAAADSSGTAVEMVDSEEGEEWVPVPREPETPIESPVSEDFVGPRLLPITPIMRYAMREVAQEYQEIQSISEYASLADPDEY
ncbi:hypothetical protein NEOLEDRAFT_666254 [Neolentinus lepideus HHB14362 ss-1]|uniref:AAA+ ATPase domain-containing protein n=1 Tax=Neolentinus lepideus HHB14362 ss-1 TaxID=1314782 RepID=A0A165QDR6_9AGAM|nr:hypothetical protein NEOLEDRAFT_666254 [Neolentinus lepideus HHB14362 ss-1]